MRPMLMTVTAFTGLMLVMLLGFFSYSICISVIVATNGVFDLPVNSCHLLFCLFVFFPELARARWKTSCSG